MPFTEPPVIGVKTTLKMQLAPCGSALTHVLEVIRKFVAPVPDKLSVGAATVTPVRFCKITGHGAVLAP